MATHSSILAWEIPWAEEPGRLLLLLLLSHFSCVQFFVTLWTVPLSMEFLRQEYWSGLQLPSTRDLPDPGIKPTSPALQEDSIPLRHLGSPK